MTIGGVVWMVIATAVAIWTAITFASPRLTSIVDVLAWFLRSWLGRTLLLCGWLAAGWHLFCQRP